MAGPQGPVPFVMKNAGDSSWPLALDSYDPDLWIFHLSLQLHAELPALNVLLNERLG